MYIYIYIYKCRDSIVVRVLGWDLNVRSNHNLDLNGRLAESKRKEKKKKENIMYINIYNMYISRPQAHLLPLRGAADRTEPAIMSYYMLYV